MLATRRFILASSAFGAMALTVPAAAQAASDKRLFVIILRGGMDGLAAVPPVSDPDFTRLRGVAAGALSLDQTFSLHAALPKLHAMYAAGDALPIQACATAYRDRSHFDAQNMLETGADHPFARPQGWLNAALANLAPARKTGRREIGVALSEQAPLILRGAAPVATWSQSNLPDVAGDTVTRLMDLYRHNDPALAHALDNALATNAMAADAGPMDAGNGRNAAALMRVAATFLKDPNGPVAAMMDLGGWDTHANEVGVLTRNLTQLDNGLDAFKTDMGPKWRDTVVIIATEFGRTAALNGASGADHGTGAAAFLVGGAVNGGRVLADWPGLSPSTLYQNRDVRPTTDLRAVLKGVLSDHLQISDSALSNAVFAGAANVRATPGLIRA